LEKNLWTRRRADGNLFYISGWMRGARAVRAMEVCCAARNGMKSTAGASFLLTTFCTLAGM